MCYTVFYIWKEKETHTSYFWPNPGFYIYYWAAFESIKNVPSPPFFPDSAVGESWGMANTFL